MAQRGKISQVRLALSPGERADLCAVFEDVRTTPLLARRVRLILCLTGPDPLPLSQIARCVQIARRHVYKWAQRYRDEGLEGLRDRRSWPA